MDMDRMAAALLGGRALEGEAGESLKQDDIVGLLLELKALVVTCYLKGEGEERRSDRARMLLFQVRSHLAALLAALYGDGGFERADRFLEQLPQVMELLDMDLQAFLDGDPAAENKSTVILAYPGFFAIMTYRLAHVLYEMGVPMIPRVMSEYAHTVTGIDINPGARIGRSFFIDHGTGVVVGETCRIGDNVKIYQGVTLGALSTRKGRQLMGVQRHPSIEDGVTLYSGAVVLGGDTVIGRGSTIGGGTFITESIPPFSKVSCAMPELHVVEDARAKEAAAADELFERL